jgi:hypothetical protein
MTRPVPAEITDVLVERGDRDVVRRTAGNAAAISAGGYSELIKRARQDGVLTLEIGQRDDLSGDQLKELLGGTLDVICRRLWSVVKPARHMAIRRAMNELEEASLPPGPRRDFSAAQRTVLGLHREGHLEESGCSASPRPTNMRDRSLRCPRCPGSKSRLADRARPDPVVVRPAAHVRRRRYRSGANESKPMPSTAERVMNCWRSRQTI